MSILPSIIMIHFAMSKDLIRRVSNKDTCFVDIFAVILCFMMLTITAIVVLPFAIFRMCLLITLKLRYRKLYGGLLSGNDAMFEIHKESVVINIVAIYSCKEDKHIRINEVKKFVDKIHESNYKFGCSISSIFGYRYLTRQQIKSEDVLEFIDTNSESSMTRTTLYEYIEQNCFTIKQNSMWKVHGFLQPIRWSTSDGKVKQYALILTFRHSLGDASTIIGALKRIVEGSEATTSHKSTLIPVKTDLHSNPLFRVKDAWQLKLKHRSDRFITTFNEEKLQYLPIIKALKNKLNVSFTDVIGAAICASVRDYVIQRKLKTRTISGYSIVRVFKEELEEITKGTYNFEEPTNTSSAVLYEIPWEGTPRNMNDRILSFNLINKIMHNSADYTIPHIYCRDICSYIPIWCIRLIAKHFWDGSHFFLSNLVGISRRTYGTCKIDDVFFCAPTSYHYGFCFCIFSYDHRLGITLASTPGCVDSRKDLQLVLDNTLNYINKAGREILHSEDFNAVK